MIGTTLTSRSCSRMKTSVITGGQHRPQPAISRGASGSPYSCGRLPSRRSTRRPPSDETAPSQYSGSGIILHGTRGANRDSAAEEHAGQRQNDPTDHPFGLSWAERTNLFPRNRSTTPGVGLLVGNLGGTQDQGILVHGEDATLQDRAVGQDCCDLASGHPDSWGAVFGSRPGLPPTRLECRGCPTVPRRHVLRPRGPEQLRGTKQHPSKACLLHLHAACW